MTSLERHFVHASVAGLLARGHPYDFVETYQAVRALYGYRTHYVNLGLWTEGVDTVEPGRELAMRVAEPLALAAGERLIDAGAGLGQAAIDLARAYELASVRGLNVNPRQVAFANELAADARLADRVSHTVADACTALAELPAGSAHGVVAIECVGHFQEPLGFLRGARQVLAPGRRLSMCLNVAHRELRWTDRRLFLASFGFVPARRDTWEERLSEAGFTRVEVVDLTARVTGALSRIIPARLAHPSDAVRALPWTTRRAAAILQRVTADAVAAERLKYLLISAERP